MRTIRLAFLCLLGLFALPGAALAAESTSVHAILVVASNEKGGSDPKLAPYEPALRSVLRYQSYRAAGEGSASVAGGGKATISLGGGNRVEVQGDPSGGVQVMRGGRAIPVTPGNPVVVLGGKANDKGDQYAIIVTAN